MKIAILLLAAALLIPGAVAVAAASDRTDRMPVAEAVREKPAARSGTEAETPELFVENGRWGYRTAERVVVAPLYDNGFDFTEGLAAVQLGGTWHYIDTAGRTRLSCPGCAAVKPFRGGKAQVVRNGERQEIAHPLKTPRYQ